MDEIKDLREEIAKLRERVAVLEAQRTPAPAYIPWYQVYPYQFTYTGDLGTGTTYTTIPAGDVATDTVTIGGGPWRVRIGDV